MVTVRVGYMCLSYIQRTAQYSKLRQGISRVQDTEQYSFEIGADMDELRLGTKLLEPAASKTANDVVSEPHGESGYYPYVPVLPDLRHRFASECRNSRPSEQV
jgi:hypothetical protein